MILTVFCRGNRVFVRWKHSADHWSVVRKKIHPVDKALTHFDDFYKSVFAKNWEAIRDGLLGKQKYVAVVNNYGDNKETMEKLEYAGALNVRTLFKLEKEYFQDNFHVKRKQRQLKEIFEMASRMSETVEQREEKPVERVHLSLESSLENAEYDYRRLVDSKNALSTEILHEFIPATKIKGMDDFVAESDHYRYYNTGNFDVKIEREYDLHFPAHLNVYCFEAENFSDFQPGPSASTGVLNYYLMDGGSIMPVLALNVQPGDRVLDLCAAPGGKSLLVLQTLYPKLLVSNDVSMSRTNRIHKVFQQFLFDLNDRWIQPGKLRITCQDGRFMSDDIFDKILVDVPCTTDRHSLKENDNNIFKPSRIKERLKLPELQCELLFNALKLVRKGGIVVYSTCSLSPIQNDGVVHMALKQIYEETRAEFVVKDLSIALLQTCSVLKLADAKLMKYGHLVVPHLPQNYGPTYFCKLERLN